MSVAIVVMSCNGWNVTDRFLSEMYENTEIENFELRFIDNGSTDGSPAKLEAFASTVPNMTVRRNKRNEGVIGGRNQGFRWYMKEGSERHDSLMFLDNDQYVKDGWLDQHLSVLNRGYDLIGVEAWQLNRSFIPTQRITSNVQWFSYVGCGGMLMRKGGPAASGLFR